MKHFIAKNNGFVCQHCGRQVKPAGRGTETSYRNHCPFCLWSKHVDDEVPGDRRSLCRGLMPPVGVETRRTGEFVLLHKCQVCGKLSKNRTADDDDFTLALSLAGKNGD
ncbi:MAG: RNHCP domain-containing protein [bacterium]|nr:RNHCP domain-containing protein [bacterium]